MKIFAVIAALTLLTSCSTRTICTLPEKNAMNPTPTPTPASAAQLVHFETIEQPALIFVGKAIRANMNDFAKGVNPIPAFWGKCFSDNVFATLEAQAEFVHDAGYGGLMIDAVADGAFTYICGMMMMSGVKIPEGFTSHELAPTQVAVTWIKGRDVMEVCKPAHEMSLAALKEKGFRWTGPWCMELYTCPRFTTPDENGDIIIDFYMPCK